MGFECRDALCTFRTNVPVQGFTPLEDVKCSRYLNGLRPAPDSRSPGNADVDLFKRCAVAYDFAGALSNGCSLFSDRATAAKCDARHDEQLQELWGYFSIFVMLSSAVMVSLAATGFMSSFLFGSTPKPEGRNDLAI